MTCPFCGEQDFDALGLKRHLLYWGCDVFEAVSPENPDGLNGLKAADDAEGNSDGK